MGENSNSEILDLGGRVDKSSTVTTRHVVASQNWIENKPKTRLWHSETRIGEKCDTDLLTEKDGHICFMFKIFCVLTSA